MANLKFLDFALPGTAAGVVPALYLQLADLFARGPVRITLRRMAEIIDYSQSNCRASFCSVILCVVYIAQLGLVHLLFSEFYPSFRLSSSLDIFVTRAADAVSLRCL